MAEIEMVILQIVESAKKEKKQYIGHERIQAIDKKVLKSYIKKWFNLCQIILPAVKTKEYHTHTAQRVFTVIKPQMV